MAGTKVPQKNSSSATKRIALVATISVLAGGAAVLVVAAVDDDSSDEVSAETNSGAVAAVPDYGSANRATEDRIPLSGERTATLDYGSADAFAARFETNSFPPEYGSAKRATEDRNPVSGQSSVDYGSADALAQRASDSEAFAEASADRAAKGYYQDISESSIEAGDFGSADAAEQSGDNSIESGDYGSADAPSRASTVESQSFRGPADDAGPLGLPRQ